MRKDGAEHKTIFRSDERIFQVNGVWWFAEREGDQGPFPSRDAALSGLTRFILDIRTDVELSDVSRLDKSPNGSSSWDISSY